MNMVDTEQLAERLEKAPFLPRYPIHLTCSEDELRAIIYALRAPAHIGDECRRLSDNDLYYLRSIYRQMKEFQDALADTARFTLGGEAMADNLNWLDCFIDQHQRALTGGE